MQCEHYNSPRPVFWSAGFFPSGSDSGPWDSGPIIRHLLGFYHHLYPAHQTRKTEWTEGISASKEPWPWHCAHRFHARAIDKNLAHITPNWETYPSCMQREKGQCFQKTYQPLPETIKEPLKRSKNGPK